MSIRPWEGAKGDGRCDDGRSRPFLPDSADPRQVIAQTLAGRHGWAEIRPGHWAEAAAVVKALREQRLLVDRRTAARRKETAS